MPVYSKKLAEKFNMSASTLRNYEAKGLIPPAERSSSGYRVYTQLHEAYLACIQAMAPAFGMEVTTEVLVCLRRGETDHALWLVREKEVALYQEKSELEQWMSKWEAKAAEGQLPALSQRFNIHEAALRAGVPKSAIRYWEKAGLIAAERDPANDYRQYNEGHLLKIRLIQALQNAVYSEDTVKLKRSIAAAHPHHTEEILALASSILIYFNHTLRSQMSAVRHLSILMQAVEADDRQPY